MLTYKDGCVGCHSEIGCIGSLHANITKYFVIRVTIVTKNWNDQNYDTKTVICFASIALPKELGKKLMQFLFVT